MRWRSRVERDGPVTTVILDRPQRPQRRRRRRRRPRSPTPSAAFDADPDAAVAVLYGEGGTFCAGADLKARRHASAATAPSPTATGRWARPGCGCRKPVIAAIAGYAVAGGLELALWCDLRVADEDAVLGVFCRRWGVPLIDGGTVRLPRLIGASRAMDLILTGRPVDAAEALDDRAGQPGGPRRDGPRGGRGARRASSPRSRRPACATTGCRCSQQEGLDERGGDGLRARGAAWISLAADGLTGAARFAAGEGRHGLF